MKNLNLLSVILGGLSLSPLSTAAQIAKDAPKKDVPQNAAFCMECLKIRVGLPRVARGPSSGQVVDMPFVQMKLPNGRFRGFPGVGSAIAVDGDAPWDMGAPGVTVLGPGGPGSMARCGQWLVGVEPAGSKLLGWVYQETACNYQNPAGQTHSSSSLATSTDNGLTWHIEGFIIQGKENDKPQVGLMTGEACATPIDGQDGYYYASCTRNRDRVRYMARAPITNPGPGNWKKYFKGAFTQPGVGGDASSSGNGGAIAYWLQMSQTAGITYAPRARMPGDTMPAPGGIYLDFSDDHIHFISLPEPLLLVDGGGWARPNPYEYLGLFSLLDAHTSSTTLSGNQWNLFYMDIQPNEGLSTRYLVVREIEVSKSRRADEPQVGVLLGHWYSAKRHEHWSTIAAVPGSYTDYKLEGQSGYLMTVGDGKRPSVELEDCVTVEQAHADHILAQKGVCEGQGYTRQRSVGWVYSTPQPYTQPLYSCYSESEKSHFAANGKDCDNRGKVESLLGYDLKQQ